MGITTAPICIKDDKLEVSLTNEWFLSDCEYNAHAAGVRILVNGLIAFREIHHAIAIAKKNVCIICWGFQPSMYFVRNGSDTVSYPGIGHFPVQIGKLLEKKAKEGVKIRILCFAFEAPSFMLGRSPTNITGMKETVGESNTPGRWDQRMGDRPPYATDEQYEYDYDWYHRYDDNQSIENEVAKGTRTIWDKASRNLEFYSRGFDATDRAFIAAMSHDDLGIGATTKAALAFGASHHQKTVLVDYDDPQKATAYIMGHNMLDEYWDTDDHFFARKSPRVGRNGTVGPREDFSTKLTGPIVGDVFFNFKYAWQRETGQALNDAKFATYLPRFVRGANPMEHSVPAFAQAVRTQPQTFPKTQNIKKAYFNAVQHVSNYIFIENQYFRWPPLAEKIKEAARLQYDEKRKTPIYLFVITNSTDDGVGKGTINTYRMMEALGRRDTVPGITKAYEYDDVKARAGQAQQKARMLQSSYDYLKPISTKTSTTSIAQMEGMSQVINVDKVRAATKAQLDKAKAEAQAAEAERKRLEAELEAVEAGKKEVDIPQVDQKGLKTHICTLVAPDSPPGKWLETYIHAKLMIVNDAFTTIGSANINTRSMEVDSEMNVLLDRPEIAQPLRKKLWGMHTNGAGGGDNFKEEFYLWQKIINLNKEASQQNKKPVAALRGFLRLSSERSNSD